jgi:hypothetical protein
MYNVKYNYIDDETGKGGYVQGVDQLHGGWDESVVGS